tara:strand:+ start:1729 stop:2211 length:483 start_codon:yes stop_codon:yes gene_type:complete
MNEFSTIETPIGTLGIHANSIGVYHIRLANDVDYNESQTPYNDQSHIIKNTLKQLREYFYENRKTFSVPLDLHMPPFYKKVLLEVTKIPFGKTVSYQKIAHRAGNAKASRAAGSANANNPIPIIIPCHRILASNGTLGGYGGGLDKKMILLEHEGLDVRI